MEILSPENFTRSAEIIRAGGVMIFPTETTYGISCDATNQTAVSRIFPIKERRPDKTFLVVMPNVEMAQEFLEWNSVIDQLAQRYWPGALTVVGRAKKDFLVDGVVSNIGTMAVRVTNYPWLQRLLMDLSKPLVATSANFAGAGEVYSFDDAINTFIDRRFQPDAIVNAGILPFHPPTTLVDATGIEWKILRQGEIKIKL